MKCVESHTDQEKVINATRKQLPAISSIWNASVNQKDLSPKICFAPMHLVVQDIVAVAFLASVLAK